MAFDPKKLMEGGALIPALEHAFLEAYRQGYDDAVQRMVSVVQSPDLGATPRRTGAAIQYGPVQRQLDIPEATDGSGRAPRGLVQKILGDVIEENPGLTVSDYEKMVVSIEPDISPKSVGNELRRGEGSRYKRDRPGGYRWFPVSYKNETTGEALPSIPVVSSFQH